MSQPFNRGASVPAPGRVDKSLGEFWVDNPWDIFSQGHNLSSYERKRVFLNLRGRDFLDISFLTHADVDGDGRSAVSADFRNDGRQDVVLRQAGGGPLLIFENQFPRRHYLNVSLRGTKSNRLGIGARLTALVHGQPLVRELYPVNSFRSQQPSLVHFGLGDHTKVDRLTIQWPSGTEQRLSDLDGDRHIVIEEGSDAVETVVPGKTMRP